MKKQRSLILIKPDGTQRQINGKIIQRFERAGLKIVAMKFLMASRQMVIDHYPSEDEWLSVVGNRTLDDYSKRRIDPKTVFGSDDAIEIGRAIKEWLVDYVTGGPTLAIVIEAYDAIAVVRKIVGATIPSVANPGTIRGDFSHDNVELANEQLRPLYNIIHASGSPDEAEGEIKVWFTEDEIMDYHKLDEDFMFKTNEK